jgi:hypothetical protein
LQVFVFFHKVENGSCATKQKLEEQAELATLRPIAGKPQPCRKADRLQAGRSESVVAESGFQKRRTFPAK